MVTTEVQIAQLTGTITPVNESYRYNGPAALWQPTHPPYQEPALFAGDDGWKMVGAESFTASDTASPATRSDTLTSNHYAAWLMLTGQTIRTQCLNIPGWWKRYALFVILMKNGGGTGLTKWQVQRQYSFAGDTSLLGDDVSGSLNRVTSPTAATVDMGTLTSFILTAALVDDDIVVPDKDPTHPIPWPWRRFTIIRSATGDTFGATAVAVLGLAALRRA